MSAPPALAFISYRHDDSLPSAHAVAQRLKDSFGEVSVFIDQSGIDPADIFADRLNATLAAATLLIAVIGPDWLSSKDLYHRRRLDQPGDWVHDEIHHFIVAKKPILPLLLSKTPLPVPKGLPPTIAGLSGFQAFELRYDRWEADLSALAERLVELGFGRASPKTSSRRSRTQSPPSRRPSRAIEPPQPVTDLSGAEPRRHGARQLESARGVSGRGDAASSLRIAADAAPVTLFYSYAHEDESLRDELQAHLKILERRGLLAPFHDRKIVAGEDWSAAIDTRMRNAELVLLLISNDFIASDYIMGTELRTVMERHAQGATVVVPIIVRPVDLDIDNVDALPFLAFQGLPTNQKPVTSWRNRDEAWTDVAKGLRRIVDAILERRAVRVSMASAAVRATRDDKVSRAGAAARRSAAQMPSQLSDPVTLEADPVLARINADVLAQLDHAERVVLLRIQQGHGVDVLPQLDRAQRARSASALDAETQRLLRAGVQSLIDLGDQKRVLWVDDTPDNNRLEMAALAKLQIEVITATNTPNALGNIVLDAEGFDLVISDWERPADGPEAGLALLREIRQWPSKKPNVPFVFYHGLSDIAPRRARAAKAQAAGALGEAVLPSELMALVLRAFELT